MRVWTRALSGRPERVSRRCGRAPHGSSQERFRGVRRLRVRERAQRASAECVVVGPEADAQRLQQSRGDVPLLHPIALDASLLLEQTQHGVVRFAGPVVVGDSAKDAERLDAVQVDLRAQPSAAV